MERKNFWIKFQHGLSEGKVSFWAPKDKYKPNLWPILGMGEMSIQELKNIIDATVVEVGVSRVYCLCTQGNEQKVIRVLCSSNNLSKALNDLPGNYIYDWLISDVYLNYSDVPISKP